MSKSNKLLNSLVAVQAKLKAPKNQYNNFAKYSYRSCEDILQAARPLCNENGLVLGLTDEIIMIGDRYYVKATAGVTCVEDGDTHFVSAFARECDTKKGMDDSQLTGACSSYARKYALCGLFAIDDNKDADSVDTASQPPQQTKVQNAKKNTQAQQKAPQSQAVDAVDAEKALLKQLQETAKKEGLSNDDITMMIHERYGKAKWNDLAASEKKELATKTIEVWREVMKKLGGAA